MKRRAGLQSTLVGAFMVMAATFSGAAYADWGPDHGTSGGGTYYEFSTLQYSVAAHLWSSNGYASAIQFKTNNYQWTSAYGNTGGEDWGEASCPYGSAVVGIYGTADTYVNSLGIICSGGLKVPSTAAGDSSNGTYFYDQCPTGTYVQAVRLRAGNWIDQMAIYCGQLIF